MKSVWYLLAVLLPLNALYIPFPTVAQAESDTAYHAKKTVTSAGKAVKQKTAEVTTETKEKASDLKETVKEKAGVLKEKAIQVKDTVKEKAVDVKNNLTNQSASTDAKRASDKTPVNPPMAAMDADMQQVLTTLATLNPKPIEYLTPEQARMQPNLVDAIKQLKQEKNQADKPDSTIQVKSMSVTGAAGPLSAKLYAPDGAKALPVIVYFHGGGWVLADNEAYDASARALAKQAHALVISANYRRAPEHPYPAAHQDAFAVYKWALDNVAAFSGNPKKIAVAGESAGANLAANVSIMARDQLMPMPVHQLLIYPVVSTTMDTASYGKHANAKPLNKAMMKWFFSHTLPDKEAMQSPAVNLLKADLHQLPGTTLITAEIDPLQTEGQQLSDKLKKSGVSVTSEQYNGVTHEFFGLAPWVKKAEHAQRFAAEQLKAAFAQETATVNTSLKK
jgi:acetyl esterase